MIKSFKEFAKDCQGRYKVKFIRIANEDEMGEVLYDLYDAENFEMDYENKIIELYY